MLDAKSSFQRLLHRVPNAADFIDVSRAQMYKLIDAGEVEVIRVGKSIRVPHDALLAFVERKRAEMKQAA
jgi:excisionase family DNA binding protein